VIGTSIYIMGGRGENGARSKTTYCFSTETNTWTTLARMFAARAAHSVCVLEGLVYVMGGQDIRDADLSSVHRFNPVTNSWSTVAPMSVARTLLGAFVLNGSMYAVGGWGGSRRLTSVESFSVTSDSWTEERGGGLAQKRNAFGAHTLQLEVDLFDNLVAKAKRAKVREPSTRSSKGTPKKHR
jgi:N-acetylneuraminic acid mutarotase